MVLEPMIESLRFKVLPESKNCTSSSLGLDLVSISGVVTNRISQSTIFHGLAEFVVISISLYPREQKAKNEGSVNEICLQRSKLVPTYITWKRLLLFGSAFHNGKIVSRVSKRQSYSEEPQPHVRKTRSCGPLTHPKTLLWCITSRRQFLRKK